MCALAPMPPLSKAGPLSSILASAVVAFKSRLAVATVEVEGPEETLTRGVAVLVGEGRGKGVVLPSSMEALTLLVVIAATLVFEILGVVVTSFFQKEKSNV